MLSTWGLTESACFYRDWNPQPTACLKIVLCWNSNTYRNGMGPKIHLRHQDIEREIKVPLSSHLFHILSLKVEWLWLRSRTWWRTPRPSWGSPLTAKATTATSSWGWNFDILTNLLLVILSCYIVVLWCIHNVSSYCWDTLAARHREKCGDWLTVQIWQLSITLNGHWWSQLDRPKIKWTTLLTYEPTKHLSRSFIISLNT